jgi:hypothetical protein
VPLDEQWNEVPDAALLESRVRGLNGDSDVIRRDLRELVGQPALDFGDQKLLADLCHVDSLRLSTSTVNW